MLTPKEKLEATTIELAQWRQAKEHRNSAVPLRLRLDVFTKNIFTYRSGDPA